MANLLTSVKSKMFIFAHRRARGMLDGEYASVFRGRSLDFDDLRDYVPGDEVRDIDWKATARTGSPLIKRYVANRRQQVLFVVDTGRNLAATSLTGDVKKNIAVMTAGVIGSLALGHGDQVALVSGDACATTALPAKGTESHLERILQTIDAVSLESGGSQLCSQLEYVGTRIKQRTLLVVLADNVSPEPRLAKILRRLVAQHEILWVTLSDAALAGPDAVQGTSLDVEAMGSVLTVLAQAPDLAASYAAAEAQRARDMAALLKSQGIASTEIAGTEHVMGAVFTLLERHRRAR